MTARGRTQFAPTMSHDFEQLLKYNSVIQLEFDEGGRNMFNEIKTREDIRVFLEKTNSLHDGHIINVQYINNGISKGENGYWLVSDQTKLTLQILVTSIWDAVVEIEFENVLEWQIKNCYYWDMTDTSVIFDEQNLIIWTDDVFINMEEAKTGFLCYCQIYEMANYRVRSIFAEIAKFQFV